MVRCSRELESRSAGEALVADLVHSGSPSGSSHWHPRVGSTLRQLASGQLQSQRPLLPPSAPSDWPSSQRQCHLFPNSHGAVLLGVVEAGGEVRECEPAEPRGEDWAGEGEANPCGFTLMFYTNDTYYHKNALRRHPGSEVSSMVSASGSGNLFKTAIVPSIILIMAGKTSLPFPTIGSA